MPGPELIVVTLPNLSGLPKDETQLGFVIDGINSGDEVTAIEAFFNTTASGASEAVGAYISNQVSRGTNACSYAGYDLAGHLDGSPHGSPIETGTFTLVASGGGSPLPGQCAADLVLHTGYSGGEFGPTEMLPTPESAIDMGAPSTHSGRTRPGARRRGQLRLGPLAIASLTTNGKFSSQFITDVAASASALRAALNTGSLARWSVWSRRDAAVHHITGGYVDNIVKTVRRRTEDPEVRTTWT